MNIVTLENTKALVAIEQSLTEKSILSIESKDGYTLYYKESRKPATNFNAVFDLSVLKNGIYTIKLKSGGTLLKQDINIKNGNISAEPMKTEYDPVFIMKDNILRVSYLNFDKENFSLLVYQNGNLIHDSYLGNDFDMQKLFDFSWLQRGEYDVTLTTSGKEYWYSVKK